MSFNYFTGSNYGYTMNVRTAVRKQYQAKIDRAARAVDGLEQPPEGWIATVRKALGISGAQLGRMLGRTRANVSAAERAELESRATLQSMETIAAAMGCKFVYAIIPVEGDIQDVIERQAFKKAKNLVARASTHMALEKQNLTQKQNQTETKRLAQELAGKPPPDFWETKK